MKKLFVIVSAVMFLLVGCSSTDPTFKEALTNSMKSDSYEYKTTLSADIDVQSLNLPEEDQQVFELLKGGITLEQKQVSPDRIYVKYSLVDDEPLRKMGYWSAEEQAALEFMVDVDTVFFKTSADPYYFEVDFSSEDVDVSLMMAEQMKAQELMLGAFEDYMEQFDYEINNLKDKGWQTVETPEGSEKVRMIQVKFDVEDILEFASYTLGNLAEYESLNDLATEFTTLLPEDDRLKEQELSDGVQDFRNGLLLGKAFIDGTTKESLEQLYEMDIDFSIESEIGLSKPKKSMVSENTEINLNLRDQDTGENIKAVINSESLIWNVNKNVELPTVDKAVDYEDFVSSVGNIKQLPDSTPVKKYLLDEFRAEFYIDEPYAFIRSDWFEYDEASYISNGRTMVPVTAITDWLGGSSKWNQETQTLKVMVDNQTFDFTLSSNKVIVNGTEKMLNAPFEIKNDTSFVPVSFIAKEIGAKIDFYPDYYTVDIYFE
ncbi:copper amine oxidase N-terminal domain-containing protein [Bacillus solimangrovi]|uniref:Copper amine oxidase-like N-terminal domain-containing protein n=1 Tax=Bacillus solimangrovi TaxID=1305675 RepID=A0A1E5LET1_9BACI|nr:copper amine oxidase N-terminal domain-containing protein [Bacillus solimangrovi]OEH92576.1 hypothetical protein BFG57_15310 [Bacillus solimangrovi]